MALPTYNDTIAKIRKRFPDASDFEEDIEVHMDEFEVFEKRLKLKNIFLRALSTPPEDDGTGIHVGRTFYHWGFYDFTGKSPSVETIHYHPPLPSKVVPRQKILKKFICRKEISYSAYMEFKASVDAGFKVPKNYFIPEPDPDLHPDDAETVADTLLEMKETIEDVPGMMETVKIECEQFIKDRFEDYLEDYHTTSNDYYLYRADFYRKLKFEHLSYEHKLLVSAAYKEWCACYFLEGELRKAYSEQIESL